MWIIALLGLGAWALFKSKSSPSVRQQYALPPPPGFPAALPGKAMPSPMAVLTECIRLGRWPEPMLVSCAIAQCEMIGRPDLASDVIRLFVEPTVRAYYSQQGEPLPMPAGGDPHATPPSSSMPAPGDQGAPPQTPGSGLTASVTDDEIQALLNADPRNFAKRIQNGDVIDVQPGPERPTTDAHADAAPTQPLQGMVSEPVHMPEPVSSVVSGTIIGAVARAHAPRNVKSSPIRGVDGGRWEVFCAKIVREQPSFVSSRHIGQYRQRKERLLELGLDPSDLIDSPAQQQFALDRDLADAHYHATEAGMLSEHVGRMIAVPGVDTPVKVTLSGVLGVIQAAGLDGALSWIESHQDRKRYPNTTQAFIRTNEVF